MQSQDGTATVRNILAIGGTGMLGRPVVRQLAADGFDVRVMSRHPTRASTLLPASCEFVEGDALDANAVRAAMAGMDAVYINLATPYSNKVVNTDLEGTRIAVAEAKHAGVRHVLRLSAMGVPEAANDWWSIRQKHMADQCVIDSGVACTILRPTWFMENLALFAAGPFLARLASPSLPLWWLASEDYARQVSAALRNPAARNRVYLMQGAEQATLREAMRRFARAVRPARRLLVMPLPRTMVRLGGWFSPTASYLNDLLTMSQKYTTTFQSQRAFDDLGKPTMKIEDYAATLQSMADWPRK